MKLIVAAYSIHKIKVSETSSDGCLILYQDFLWLCQALKVIFSGTNNRVKCLIEVFSSI